MLAYNMVEQAVRLFKQTFGEYPKRVGLDYYSRWREYAQEYGPYPKYRVFNLPPQNAGAFFTQDLPTLESIPINIHSIDVEPAIFRGMHYPYHMVLCESANHETFVALRYSKERQEYLMSMESPTLYPSNEITLYHHLNPARPFGIYDKKRLTLRIIDRAAMMDLTQEDVLLILDIEQKKPNFAGLMVMQLCIPVKVAEMRERVRRGEFHEG